MRHTIYQLVQDCFTGHRKSTRQVRDTQGDTAGMTIQVILLQMWRWIHVSH